MSDDTAEVLARVRAALGDAYEVERELGGGGMSRVFLATERSLNRRVVVKILAPELASEVSAARFRQEVEMTAVLQHPHILPVLNTGAKDGIVYYITPFVEGESLRHRLKREGRLPVEDAARILHEVSGALAYAHERGIVHRDIKPENILLSNGLAVLADFGIARALAAGTGANPAIGGEERLTGLGMAMGTPGYMSPEQAAGEMDVDPRADIYSLAVVGYEMLGGQPPFTGPTPRHVMAAHLSEIPKPVTDLRDDTPPGLSAALATALAKEPADRFQTATDFQRALGLGFAAGDVGAVRIPKRWIIAAVAALALTAGGVYYARNRGGGTLDPNLVAVAPFDVLDPQLAVWKEGLVDLLSANLDGAGSLHTVPPTVVVRRWTGRADNEAATALGIATSARLDRRPSRHRGE